MRKVFIFFFVTFYNFKFTLLLQVLRMPSRAERMLSGVEASN